MAQRSFSLARAGRVHIRESCHNSAGDISFGLVLVITKQLAIAVRGSEQADLGITHHLVQRGSRRIGQCRLVPFASLLLYTASRIGTPLNRQAPVFL